MAFSRENLDSIIDEATQMTRLSNTDDNWRAAYDLLVTGSQQIKALMDHKEPKPHWTKPVLQQLIELRLRVSRLENGIQSGPSLQGDIQDEDSPTESQQSNAACTAGPEVHATTFREEFERVERTYHDSGPCLGSS